MIPELHNVKNSVYGEGRFSHGIVRVKIQMFENPIQTLHRCATLFRENAFSGAQQWISPKGQMPPDTRETRRASLHMQMILLFRKDSSHGYVLKGIESLTISQKREQAVNLPSAPRTIPRSRTHEHYISNYISPVRMTFLFPRADISFSSRAVVHNASP